MAVVGQLQLGAFSNTAVRDVKRKAGRDLALLLMA
jgi:hypothetical protein